MKNKIIFRIGFLCIIAFLIVASYLWYLYFHNYESEVLMKDSLPNLEIINSGKIDYLNARIGDSDDLIPVYYFRVKNNTSNSLSYKILIHDVSADEAGDGCTSDTMFVRKELQFELTLKGKVIAKGSLDEIKDNLLYTGKVDGNSLNDYSMRVWLNSVKNTQDSETNKHYHYVIDVEEI